MLKRYSKVKIPVLELKVWLLRLSIDLSSINLPWYNDCLLRIHTVTTGKTNSFASGFITDDQRKFSIRHWPWSDLHSQLSLLDNYIPYYLFTRVVLSPESNTDRFVTD